MSSEFSIILFVVGVYAFYSLTISRPGDILVTLGKKLKYEFRESPFTLAGYVVSPIRLFNPWTLIIKEPVLPFSPWLKPRESECRYLRKLSQILIFARICQLIIFVLLIFVLPFICLTEGLSRNLVNLIIFSYIMIMLLLCELHDSGIKKRIPKRKFIQVIIDSLFCPPLAIHATQKCISAIEVPISLRNFIIFFEKKTPFSTPIDSLQNYISFNFSDATSRADYVALKGAIKGRNDD